jgi:hypothetical protein
MLRYDAALGASPMHTASSASCEDEDRFGEMTTDETGSGFPRKVGCEGGRSPGVHRAKGHRRLGEILIVFGGS